jgi:dTDP-4-amino-4,6-dideoxygalactose transaminase
MNPFTKKLPRGVIYHKVTESIRYLLQALFMPLDKEEKIRAIETAFARYSERKHCVAFPFARTAIYFVLKNLNLPKGSEILMPPITIKGIVDVVVDLGLVPVYVEMDAETINFQMDDLRKKISPNVRVVIITPLFGLVPDVAAMVQLFRQHGIFIIEDFSQCLNGCFDGKRVGTFGDVGIYSSSSIKTMDTLGGGMALTDNDAIHTALRKDQAGLRPADRFFLVKKAWTNLVRNVATSRPYFSLFTFPLLQLIRKKDPAAALKQTGHRDKSRLAKLPAQWFCRYTSVQADIGLAHLGDIQASDRARIANVECLKANCGNAKFPATTPKSANVYWQLILPVADAFDAQVFFARRGIDSATSSLELVCALKDYPNRADLPVAESVYRNGIFIPCFPDLSRADMERIAMTVRDYFRSAF